MALRLAVVCALLSAQPSVAREPRHCCYGDDSLCERKATWVACVGPSANTTQECRWRKSCTPAPPRQTKAQARAMKHIRTRAATASAHATAALETLLNTSKCRAHWANTSLDGVSAAALVQKLRDAARTAELAHSFQYVSGIFGAPSVAVSRELLYLPNLWQTCALGASHGASPLKGCHVIFNATLNRTEIFAYGLPPCANASDCTWDEASNRIIYTTLGGTPALSRRPDPALTWGDVTLLFTHVNDMVGIAPLDSGNWGTICVPTPSPMEEWPPYPDTPPATCKNYGAWWPPVLGTLDALDHLLLLQAVQSPDANGINGACSATGQVCFGCGWVRNTLLPPEVPHAATKSPAHWEANVVGSIRYGEGANRTVKAMVASFVRHFGKPSGRVLRAWCKQRQWALLWDSCFLESDSSPDVEMCLQTRATRMLDLHVLQHTPGVAANLSLPHANHSAHPARCNWTKHANQYRHYFAGGVDTVFSLADGKAECLQLGAGVCRGVDCVNGTAKCTVRSGAVLLPSNTSEDTYDPSAACFGTKPRSQVQAWDLVNRTNTGSWDDNFYNGVWRSLEDGVPTAFVEPLALYDCGDVERCFGKQTSTLIGHNKSADCVCNDV